MKVFRVVLLGVIFTLGLLGLIITVAMTWISNEIVQVVEEVEGDMAAKLDTIEIVDNYRYDVGDDRLTLTKKGIVYVSSDVFNNTIVDDPDSMFGEKQVMVRQGSKETLMERSGYACITTCSIDIKTLPVGDFDVVFYLSDGSKHEITYTASNTVDKGLSKDEFFSVVKKPEVVSLGTDRFYVSFDDENGVSSMSLMSEGLDRVPFGERKHDREFIVDKDSLASYLELTFSTSYVVGGDEVDFSVVVDREAILAALQ